MGINYEVLSKEEDKAEKQIAKAVKAMKETGEVFALVIEKDTFDTYKLQNVEQNDYPLSREEAIQTVAAAMGEKDVVVSTTGMISRELFEYRAAKGQGHERDFLTVGSMGHASQIALGIALAQSSLPDHKGTALSTAEIKSNPAKNQAIKQSRRVWCFDGDGAAIMHMGSMAIVAEKAPKNYLHVVFNNGAHDSVGGQPTVGLKIDLPAIARAVGYKAAYSVDSMETLNSKLLTLNSQEGPVLLEVKVHKGNRADLGRPTTTPIQNKEALMDFLRK
jgi:phosphonopyruvate decarboxylase